MEECFPCEDPHKVKHSDGDNKDFAAKEISQHRQSRQAHSRSQQLAVNNQKQAMQLITKGRHQGLRTHHQLNQLSPFHHHVCAHKLQQHNKVNAFKATIVRALKAGCIWDEWLKKWLTLDDLLNHPDPEVQACWMKSVGKELGSSFQGFKDTEGMDVCKFIPKWQVPKNKKATKPQMVCACWPEKRDGPHRTRITAGGYSLDCDGETATNSASTETILSPVMAILFLPNVSLAINSSVAATPVSCPVVATLV